MIFITSMLQTTVMQ